MEDALKVLAANAGRVRPIAGGTDVLLRLRHGTLPPDEHILLNVKNIPELNAIETGESGDSKKHNGTVRVGAAVTARQLERSELIKSHLPVLAWVANRMASAQIRATATIGGNVANASPAADLAIPLLLLDAEVETARLDPGKSNGGVIRETTSVEKFFTGPGETSLAPGGLITGFIFRTPNDGARFAVEKGGVRPAMECAVVSVGCRLTLDDVGLVADARVACGAVAPTPIRAATVEGFLEGGALTDERIVEAAERVGAAINPISDVRGSAEYRVALTRALFKSALIRCRDG